MKSISSAAIFVLVLTAAACSSTSVSDPSVGDPVSDPSVSDLSVNDPSVSDPSVSDPSTNSPSASGYYTVSGLITQRGTGKPYSNAYVRFGWLVNAVYEREAHTLTDRSGRYSIQLPAGQYQVSAGDSCDLNAEFAIVGGVRDSAMVTVPGTNKVDFVEYPLTPGADIPGVC